ncbi:IS110 family transposase [Subtercola boreus]|uniref:IS110 family transposase n=1 Tax=Subtercola boreus TaxID=120213 RepID=A0A3E0VA88_9MICO|nr:IS110 family transposase [Subtercola boreus]RFA06629.1 IS110 family transposase [Subtercola boreus]
MSIERYDQVEVFIGVDVGKGEHHAVALDRAGPGRAGKTSFDKALPNDEAKLRQLISGLKQHGRVLFVVDQPATIGALPIAVAQAEGVLVGYLPGLAMRRIADLHAGEAKTDARDAAIIAQAARTLPHALRSIQLADEQVAELSMLCGFDDDVVGQATATSNRIRGLLTQIHPALERVIGAHLDHPAVLDLLQRYPSPAAMKAAGPTRLGNRLVKLAPRMGRRLAAEISQALSEQTVVVVGTNAASLVLPRLAEQLTGLRRQRAEIAAEVERLVEAHPLQPVLTSMPGVGVRTAARLLTEISGKHFETSGHLAAYAGLAPVTRRSGTSIRGEHPSRRGNKILKRALFLSAFAALRDPTSRAYYDRKIAQGKRHNQALIALARRRCDVLYAMLRDGTMYQTPDPLNA